MLAAEEVSLGDRKVTEGPLPRALQVKDIEVPDFVLKTVGEDAFFVYQVHITWTNATTTQHPKRFSQLFALHSMARVITETQTHLLFKLESRFGSANLPEFPSKERFTSKLSRPLAECRRVLLEAYLRALRKRPTVWSSFEVCLFFSLYDVSGKVAIVTGCSAGIGKVTAFELAKCGAHVILACRNRDKTEPIIRETHNHAVEFMELDLANYASVDKFITNFRSRSLPLHLLINNAGVGTVVAHSADAYGIVIQSNHLSHFKLTISLLDILKASAPSRVIHVSSRFHRVVKYDLSSTIIAHPAKHHHLLRVEKYALERLESKLAQVLFSNTLSRRLANTGVISHCLHPGLVNTELYSKGEGFYKLFGWLSRPAGLTEEEGARTTLFAVLSEETSRVTGKYFDGCKESQCSDAGGDMKLQEELWVESEKATGLRDANT